MVDLFTFIKEKLKQHRKKRIIFPEYMDERILKAANHLAEEGIITPIFIGEEEAVLQSAKRFHITLQAYEVLSFETYPDKEGLIRTFIERRYHKVDWKSTEQALLDPNFFATMLVYVNIADGLLSGAMHTTSSAIRPALQIIKTKPDTKKVSGAYLMVRGEEKYIFADCAVNIAPSSDDLAEITIQSARTARLLQIDPKVALLSFSSMGSAQSEETETIGQALHKVKQLEPTLLVDGELQFDAAYVPQLALKKAPTYSIKGDANVFVFPSLEAGNISCKITERLGHFQAIGPILQGLNRPVNLLSRGCNEDDVYKVALITALQATENRFD